LTDINVEAPTPTIAPNAAPKFIKGKVMAKPDIAKGPTPCPMKILSTILYKDEAVIAIMAGMAYCINRLPIGFVPSSVALFFDDIV
jgi:hypothetical protein